MGVAHSRQRQARKQKSKVVEVSGCLLQLKQLLQEETGLPVASSTARISMSTLADKPPSAARGALYKAILSPEEPESTSLSTSYDTQHCVSCFLQHPNRFIVVHDLLLQ